MPFFRGITICSAFGNLLLPASNAIARSAARSGITWPTGAGLLKKGGIVDATIISAPPSTKNRNNACDLEMHRTKKGNRWHFGMKLHIGTDPRDLVHHLEGTAASVAT